MSKTPTEKTARHNDLSSLIQQSLKSEGLISEADKHPEMKRYYFGRLTPDRVAFSTGRDIQLVPKSKSGPLNYFVYPHVEVDGKVWPKDKIKLELSYKDIK